MNPELETASISRHLVHNQQLLVSVASAGLGLLGFLLHVFGDKKDRHYNRRVLGPYKGSRCERAKFDRMMKARLRRIKHRNRLAYVMSVKTIEAADTNAVVTFHWDGDPVHLKVEMDERKIRHVLVMENPADGWRDIRSYV